ncbi:hypothetical protein [Bradyrhizobium sp. SZCCHNRI1058]|uniref:hypothetical protein n=1 Tax=Bradyrhizobium sp. SZCCHNRI1058 TaxID=3057279 RepID=UPI002916B5C2|nr:hypothetical protein [Bradyrhizobium sp. SZCCHNRI1058]
MGTILEATAVIKGKDATGGAFDAVANKINRIARAANALNRDVQKQMSMASVAERQASRLQRGSAVIGGAAKMAAGAAAAYEGSRAVHALAARTAQAASDRTHEEVRMSAAGMSAQEIAEADDIAGRLSARYKSVSQTEIMHTARNIRSVVGSFEEATHILDPLMKLRVVALGAHPEHAAELGEDFDKLVKGMEIKGVTQDLAKFNHYIDGMAKAINVFGDTLRPTDYYEMFKYGRAATNALSDDFMLKTAPTLAQELGGSSAGKALSSFYTQFVGGKMSNKAVEALATYGLLDPSKVIKTTTGNVKGVKPGGIVGQEYLQPGATDPYAWTNNVLIPALAKKGVTDPAQIQEVIAAIASQQTTAQMMSIFATQQARIQKDAALVHGAKGGEAADDFLQHDPKVLQKAIGAQVDNLLGNTAAPLMPAVTTSMNWLSSGLSYMSERAKKDPLRSAAELGFGAALAGSVGADSASSLLSGAGSIFRGESAAGSMKFGLTRMTAMLAPILDIATRRDVLPATERMKSLAGLHPDKFDALHDIEDSERAAEIYGDSDPTYLPQLKAMNEAKRAKIEGDLTSLGYAPAGTPGRGQLASQWTIDDIRKATSIGSAEPAKAEVVGNATLETKVTVEPSPDFLTRVEQRVQNAINAFRSSGTAATGSTGSTGRSLPEAGVVP